MKNTILALLLAISVGPVSAAPRKPIHEVSTDQFTGDTQVTAENAGDDHLALCWWVPVEYWKAVLARDTSVKDSERKEMIRTLTGTSLLAVVQADISPMGAFRFYGEDEVEGGLQIRYVDGAGKESKISPLQEVDEDLELILGVFKPILSAAMGNMGQNFHFYVLDDKAGGERLIDPYKEGHLKFVMAKRDGEKIDCSIEMPLNSLFVPRKCPNGRDAHVSWNFCPWTGKPLE